jgi:glycosyltransferase involved in cell wall biosynthesis
LLLRTDFIPDSEVRNYLCAADAVIQPYKNATQSGVTPLAYHFEKPMIVSNVGGLAALVPHEQVGLVAEPTPVRWQMPSSGTLYWANPFSSPTFAGKKKNIPGAGW